MINNSKKLKKHFFGAVVSDFRPKDDSFLDKNEKIKSLLDEDYQETILERQKALRKKLLLQGKFYTSLSKEKSKMLGKLDPGKRAEYIAKKENISKAKEDIKGFKKLVKAQNRVIENQKKVISSIKNTDSINIKKSREQWIKFAEQNLGILEELIENKKRYIEEEKKYIEGTEDTNYKQFKKENKPEKNSDILTQKQRSTRKENKEFENKHEIELKTKNPHKYDCLGWALSDIWGKKEFMQFGDAISEVTFNPNEKINRASGIIHINELNKSMQEAMCDELNTVKGLEVQCIDSSQLKDYQKKVESKNSHSVIVAMRLAGEWKHINSGYFWSCGYHFMKYSKDSSGYASWTHKWGGDGKYKLLDTLSPDDDKAWVYNTAHEGLSPLDEDKVSKTSCGVAKSVLLSWPMSACRISQKFYSSSDNFVSKTFWLNNFNMVVIKHSLDKSAFPLRLDSKKIPKIGDKINIISENNKELFVEFGGEKIRAQIPQSFMKDFCLIDKDKIRVEVDVLGTKGPWSYVLAWDKKSISVVLHDKPRSESSSLLANDCSNLFGYQVVTDENMKIKILRSILTKYKDFNPFYFIDDYNRILNVVFDTSTLEEKDMIRMCHIPYISKTEYIYIDASNLYSIDNRSRSKSVGKASKVRKKLNDIKWESL